VKPERTKQARLTPHEDTTSAELPPAGKTAGEKLERKHQAKVATEEKEEIQFDKRRFIWPVQGTVKTHFGIQPNKTDFHNWIKIVSPAGTQVKAATSGMVIYSAQLKTFGETIIIRHEDSFATVYTHLKKRYVKIDQNVKKGEVIALIGVTDEASDAYMNFEVRLRGKARNPLFFLP
ncbi:MAG: M23 family metallopeptidase, partial [Syntrophales bacterium LBB04]|nr:M23 family metallopeptidase [Syntrophales bacterium LBB04]